ncbi:MAG: hypothetical protein VB045_06925 [Synergistaceae bacterium]|nr:hypothetical protein [Synergistaceae bacterium]
MEYMVTEFSRADHCGVRLFILRSSRQERGEGVVFLQQLGYSLTKEEVGREKRPGWNDVRKSSSTAGNILKGGGSVVR